MQAALDSYLEAIKRVYALHELHGALASQLTGALDLTDVLRSEIVLAVSAFDFYIHEVARIGMLDTFRGIRAPSDAYLRFQVSLKTAASLSEHVLDAEIRTRNGYAAFQHPDKIADAIRLISNCDIWEAVADEIGVEKKSLRSDFSLIIDRRNKIAHEADRDPSFPATLWPIDRGQVEYTLNLVDRVARAIFVVVR